MLIKVDPRSRDIRTVSADDHPATRQGVRTTLEKAPDIEVVGIRVMLKEY
jgi:hypothetical protein